jgi:hypothetical protein
MEVSGAIASETRSIWVGQRARGYERTYLSSKHFNAVLDDVDVDLSVSVGKLVAPQSRQRKQDVARVSSPDNKQTQRFLNHELMTKEDDTEPKRTMIAEREGRKPA